MQPVMLQFQDPFCGAGFITTDGPVWEHPRSLLYPRFEKANMTDLPTLEKYLTMVHARISKNGSTVDLQTLISQPCDIWILLNISSISTQQSCTSSASLFTPSLEFFTDVQRFLEAFDYVRFSPGFRIALGPLKFPLQNLQWPEPCETTHRFADVHVVEFLEWRRENALSEKQGSRDRDPGDHRQQHTLLHGMAGQTDDRTRL